MSGVSTRVLDGFDDATFGREQWQNLLERRDSDNIYLTWHWQRAWWETYGEGQLLLIVAEQEGEAVALAPFYTKSGGVYFVGSGFESGWLDFIGDVSNPEVLNAILRCAIGTVLDLARFEFDFLSDKSSAAGQIEDAAHRLRLNCYELWNTDWPTLDLAGKPQLAMSAANKKDACEHERKLRRDGLLEIDHLRGSEAVFPHLGEFFKQHIARWATTPYPSGFLDPIRCSFVERLTREANGAVRMLRLLWNARPIAFQFGFHYRGRYTREISTYAIDLARYSPGNVLLRHALLGAMEEGARIFDFGIGEQAYKYRFATDIDQVRGWRLDVPV